MKKTRISIALLILVMVTVMALPITAFASDTTAPSLTVSPDSGTVTVGDTITAKASDGDSGVNHIGYYWDSASSTTPVYSTSASISVPSSTGSHTLHIYAKDNMNNWDGWKTYTYTIASTSSSDTTAPKLTASPKAGTIDAGSTITVTASDDSGINHIGYYWDSSSSTSTVSSSSASITAPTSTGSHTLYVYAKDNSSNYNSTGWKYYTYTVSSSSSTDTTAPSLTASPKAGTIDAGSTITVTASDDSGINHIGYYWDSSSSTTPVYSSSVSITAPTSTGSHTLYVYAKDNSSNYNNTGWKYYTYTVSSSSSTDTTAPTLTLSPSSGTVAVGDTITAKASDDNSGVNHIGYYWDSASSTTPVYSTSVSISVPSSTGSHTLHIYAKDNMNNWDGWKTYTYTVSSGSSSDTTAPTLSVNPSSGTISAGSTISVTASDSSGINHIGYYWDSASSTTPVYSTSASITAPTSTGSHILYVYAKDNSSNYNNTGWKYYTYTVSTSSSTDTTAPTITITPTTTKIDISDRVRIRAADTSGIKYVYYKWGVDGTVSTVNNDDDFYIDVPNRTGTRELYVRAVDNSTNYNQSDWKIKEYKVIDEEDDEDEDEPSISVSPSSGSTIEPDSKVKISAEDDDSDIDYISYYWDDDSTETEYSDSVSTEAPSSTGTHYLHVKARDDSSNENTTDWEKYTYYVGGAVAYNSQVYPGGFGEGTINSAIKTLRVEIKNAINRVKYSVNEEIEYDLDYYNGTGMSQNDVSLVFNIPSGFDVTDYNGGSLTGSTVVWNIGNISAMQSGRKYIKVKYTGSSTSENIVNVTCEIRVNNTLRDSSILRNMIFTENSKGYHQRYIVGYPGGVFKPANGITRAEFASMLVKIFNIDTSSSYTGGYYTDVKSTHWASAAIIACTREGLFSGYSNGTFKPQKIVTRAEFATVIAKKLNLGGISPIWLHTSDLENHWAMNSMEQLIRLKILQGYADGTAKPDNQITRDEAVTLFNRYNFRGTLTTLYSSFSDVKTSHWAHSDIEEAALNHGYYRDSLGNETASN